MWCCAVDGVIKHLPNSMTSKQFRQILHTFRTPANISLNPYNTCLRTNPPTQVAPLYTSTSLSSPHLHPQNQKHNNNFEDLTPIQRQYAFPPSSPSLKRYIYAHVRPADQRATPRKRTLTQRNIKQAHMAKKQPGNPHGFKQREPANSCMKSSAGPPFMPDCFRPAFRIVERS